MRWTLRLFMPDDSGLLRLVRKRHGWTATITPQGGPRTAVDVEAERAVQRLTGQHSHLLVAVEAAELCRTLWYGNRPEGWDDQVAWTRALAYATIADDHQQTPAVVYDHPSVCCLAVSPSDLRRASAAKNSAFPELLAWMWEHEQNPGVQMIATGRLHEVASDLLEAKAAAAQAGHA